MTVDKNTLELKDGEKIEITGPMSLTFSSPEPIDNSIKTVAPSIVIDDKFLKKFFLEFMDACAKEADVTIDAEDCDYNCETISFQVDNYKSGHMMPYVISFKMEHSIIYKFSFGISCDILSYSYYPCLKILKSTDCCTLVCDEDGCFIHMYTNGMFKDTEPSIHNKTIEKYLLMLESYLKQASDYKIFKQPIGPEAHA